MDNEMLGVSIIIPAYNTAEFIVQTLESLIAQSSSKWEAIVIDDGSSDNTLAIAKGYAQRDPRFRIFSQPNQGVSAARNAGICRAKFDWLLFLDADDWIAPDFLEKMTKLVVADPDLDIAYCNSAKVYPDGSQIANDFLPASQSMFPVFARYCAFAIHVCIVRRSRVESVGGFDPSLITCEDWDLWQRIMRSGCRFDSLNEVLAYYRVRPASASMDGLQMLKDGLRVIQLGHALDPRVHEAHPAWAAGMPAENLFETQLTFTCWPAGLAIGNMQDIQVLVRELPNVREPGLEPQSIASILFVSVLLPKCLKKADWLELWPTVQPLIGQFLQGLEEQSLSPDLARRTAIALERMILEQTAFVEQVTIGSTAGVRVEVTHPIQDLSFSKEAERVYCKIEMEGDLLGAIELPVFHSVLSKYVLVDTIAAKYAWVILGRFFSHTVYRDLSLKPGPKGLSLRRGNITLAEGLSHDMAMNWSQLHDQIGWLVFLQEIWSRPDWENKKFYTRSADWEHAIVRQQDRDVVLIEITDKLVDIQTPAKLLRVIYSIGGAVTGSIKIHTQRHLIRASQLQAAINTAAGYELCIDAVREGLIGRPLSGADSLHTRLAAAAKNRQRPSYKPRNAIIPPLDDKRSSTLVLPPRILSDLQVKLKGRGSSLLIGRRFPGMLGTSHSRRAVLPATAASELVETAVVAGETVLQFPETSQAPDQVIYAPELIYHPEQCHTDLATQKNDFKHDWLNQIYLRDSCGVLFGTSEDPWKSITAYKRIKYEQTLGLLPQKRYARALELVCAEGQFTMMLAPQVEHLVAADISEIALHRASERCTGFKNIHYMQLDLTKDPLGDDEYDLIVSSEVPLYVGGRDALQAVVQKIANALKPGGYFLTAHPYLVTEEPKGAGFAFGTRSGRKVIKDYVRSNQLLTLQKEIRTSSYCIQLFQRQPYRPIAKLLNRPKITGPGKQPASLPLAYCVPILMYHRVAPTGSPKLARYRVTPEAFSDQLRYLRDAGYHSITLDEWRIAQELKKPLLGKPVIITFDDGYCDFKDFAWPSLRRYGFSAVVFLVSNEIGKTNRWDRFFAEEVPLMDWSDIQFLQNEGIEFGSHSASHPHLDGKSLDEVVREASVSRMILQQKLRVPINSFAYPYGSTDPVVQHLIGGCGYIYGLTTISCLCESNDSLLALPRIEVAGTDDLRSFREKIESDEE